MLYLMYEAQSLALKSIRQSAVVARSFMETPGNAWSSWPGNRVAATGLDFIDYFTRPFGKPDFAIDSVEIDGVQLPVVEEVVLAKPFCELRRFKRASSDTAQDKVLIVAPMSGHYATLVRETIQNMLKEYDVYVTDWICASQVPASEGSFDFDDYIDYSREFMQWLGPDVHVLAVCQPGPPVLAAIALMSEDEDPCTPRSMVYFGSPFDPNKNPTEPNRFAQMHTLQWFENSSICQVPQSRPGAGRRVYPGFMQLTHFINMNFDRHYKAYANYYHNLYVNNSNAAKSHEDFYDNYNAVMDMTADFYLQTLEKVFQKADIVKGTLTHRGRRVNPAAISKTRLMTIEGEKDDVTGQGQTRAAHDICTSLAEQDKLHHLQEGAGHYGVFSGRQWRNVIAPKVIEFIAGAER